MRTTTICQLAIGVLLGAILGIESADAASLREKLARLAVPPHELPKSCSLRWKVPPSTLSPQDDSRALLEMTLAFWFGEETELRAEDVELATINTYAPEWGDPEEDRVSIFSLAFEGTGKAKDAQASLKALFGNSPFHRIARSGKTVVLFVARPSAGEKCTESLWDEVEGRL